MAGLIPRLSVGRKFSTYSSIRSGDPLIEFIFERDAVFDLVFRESQPIGPIYSAGLDQVLA